MKILHFFFIRNLAKNLVINEKKNIFSDPKIFLMLSLIQFNFSIKTNVYTIAIIPVQAVFESMNQ